VLDDPESTANSNSYSWDLLVTTDGDALGYLHSDDGSSGCVTDATATATGYALTGSGACARSVPRSLEFGTIGLHATGASTFAADMAPDASAGMAGPVDSAAQGEAIRLAGTDRVLTALELSADGFEDGQAGAVVVAASMSFPDALAGGPLAFYTSAPMLLTGADGLDARVRTEIERVLAPGGQVYVLGGTAALSDKVVTDIRGAGFEPQRVAGVNRFETATAIADTIDQTVGGHSAVLIADGTTFTDALIAGAAAPAVGGVVLLTSGSTMPDATAGYLADDETDHTAIGMPAATAAGGARSITGSNPSDLSAKVADALAPIHGAVAVASQASFADALAGGPHIASLGGPLLLTDPQTLSTATRDAIAGAKDSLREVVVYGGTAAVSAAVIDQIKAAL
jgi:putative cell wall-binding protein